MLAAVIGRRFERAGSLGAVDMDPVVHLRSAVSLLGRFPALAGVDLDVARGEIVLLQGPNGAGKTTLLRGCAGLVPITAGEAIVLGVGLRVDRRAIRRRVALLGHAGFLYDDLTVADNVRFAVRAAGLPAVAPQPAPPTRRRSPRCRPPPRPPAAGARRAAPRRPRRASLRRSAAPRQHRRPRRAAAR